jgi:hypothetical protein
MKKCLHEIKKCGMIRNCDTLIFPCSFLLGQSVLKHIDFEIITQSRSHEESQRPKGGTDSYEQI